MSRNTNVPDAWDDDWETAADKIPATEEKQPDPEPPAPKTKAERLARHVETNRKLWESADTPETFHFLEANNTVPLQSKFKPQVKVLSRKPMIAKRDPTTGMSQMTLDDEEDEQPKIAQPTAEEIRARQRREREEKQRRYDEARAKIFGESAPSSGASSPSGTVTPPRSDGQHPSRGRGRGRGGGGSGQRSNNSNHNIGSNSNSDERPFNGRRQNNTQSTREPYDPNYSPKPDSSQGRGSESDGPVRMIARNDQQQAIRAPRGPDGSGRGGFGFAKRGAKNT